MNFQHFPRIQAHQDAPKLDPYDARMRRVPQDSFVISRNTDGSARSNFGDFCWDFSAYTPENKTARIYFNFWGKGDPSAAQRQLCGEIRVLAFGLVWWRDSSPLAVRTLINYAIVLCALANYAEKQSSTVFSILGSQKLIIDFIETSSSGWMTETLGSMLGNFSAIDPRLLDFKLVAKKTINQVLSKGSEYRANIKQHPPIPTRIYAHLISSLENILKEWDIASSQLLDTTEQCGTNLLCGRSIDQQKVISRERNIAYKKQPTFEDILGIEGRKYLLSRNRQLSVRGLSYVLAEIQTAARLMIQTFSGAREDEIAALPYDCIEKILHKGKIRYILKGRTTKFNHGRSKPAKWVTNEQAYKAILISQSIARAIYKSITALGKSNSNDRETGFLFISTSHLGFSGKAQTKNSGKFGTTTYSLTSFPQLRAQISASIEDEDLVELDHIDPHRAWRSEGKFQIGKKWHFTTHQLRRSLALYAQRSGLVSLPSLRRQLQHLTDSMASYYARGSIHAKSFISDNLDHFAREWQAATPESSGLSYILNVLQSKDNLAGGHAVWVTHQTKKAEGTVLTSRRDATMAQFRKGEIAYQETLIGGCTSLVRCEKSALSWLGTACLSDNCKNLVCNPAKLDKVIKAQTNLVDRLDKKTLEYRTELNDLRILTRAQQKIRKDH